MSKHQDPSDRGGSGKQDDGPVKKKSPWLHAWHDPVAGFSAMDCNVRLVDLVGDGDHRLVVADMARKLIVYKGTQRVSEPALLETPTALAQFYTDATIPRTPVLAVAAGPYIYIYRHLKPYFKFSLPAVDLDKGEESVWDEQRKGLLDATQTADKLAQARDNGVKLSSAAVDLLALDDPNERVAYLNRRGSVPHVQHTVVTCMDSIHKGSEDDDAISSLVLGTEAKQLLILDHHGSGIITKVKLPGVPVFLAVSGLLDADWRVAVACRDARIYTVKGGDVRGSAVVLGQAIDLEAQACALIRVDRTLVIATMDRVVCGYSSGVGGKGGKREWSLGALPAPVLALEPMQLRRSRVLSAYLVALKGGEVRVYRDKVLLDTLHLMGGPTVDPVALRFGKFGREDNSLVILHKSGALSVKILQRSAFQDTSASNISGPPPEQDVPLNVPKKTKLFVEQTQREREQAVDMHRTFQRDLGRLRLNTARAYVSIITQGHNMGVSRFGGGASLRLNAQVMGLGPLFKLMLEVQNEGKCPLQDLPLALCYDRSLYALQALPPLTKDKGDSGEGGRAAAAADSLINIPLLLPGVSYRVAVCVRCLNPLAGAQPIKALVLNRQSSVPLLCAVVNMPVSEVEED